MSDLGTTERTAPPDPVSGPVLFARYAFPPNQHGYCGPDDADGFFASGLAADESRLRGLVQGFDGALPFLQLIADGTPRSDPLHREVVEAYWLGGAALDQVNPADAVALAAGPLFRSMVEALGAGAVPHHSFVVFCVYPWVAMLGDARRTPQALNVLDGCRIRWGRVLDVSGDQLTAESRPLAWDGVRLGLGPPVVETVRHAIDGRGLASKLAPGDWVTMHWDWVCDRVSDQQRRRLQTYSARSLALANKLLADRAAASHERDVRYA